MKNRLLSFAALLFIFTSSAQNSDLYWIKTYQSASYSGESYPDQNGKHIVTADGGYIWAGPIEISGANHTDILVVKFNSSGTKVWEKLLDGESSASLVDIDQNPDGTYLVAVGSMSVTGDYSNSPGSYDGYEIPTMIFKLNVSGTIQWGIATEFPVKAIASLADGTFVAAGQYTAICGCSDLFGCLFGYDCPKTFLYHFTSLGTEIQFYYDFLFSTVEDIKVNSNGAIIWRSHSAVNAFSFPSMQILWSYTRQDFGIKDFCVTESGNYFIVGGLAETVQLGIFPFVQYTNASLAMLGPDGSEIYYQEIPEIEGVLYTSSSNVSNYGIDGCTLVLGSGNQPVRFLSYSSLGEQVSNVNMGTAITITSLASQQSGIFTAFGYSTFGNVLYPDGVLMAKYGPTAISTANPTTLNNCAGQHIDVAWTATSEVEGNFQVELSNGSGSFTSPTIIGTGTSSPISCIIPSNTPAGASFRVRVVRISPLIIGTANASNISIYSFQQSTLFEGMGVVAVSTTVAAHESANGFDNDSYTMTGSATISNTNSSNGYAGASGGANVFFGNTAGSNFQIAGINTSGTDVYSISFGYYKSSSGGGGGNNILILEVSSDGVNYTPLTLPSSSGSGWFPLIATGSIPNTSNLRIRFTRQSGQNANLVGIDDIQLIKPNTNLTITASGPLNFCDNAGSVVLTGPSSGNWLWNTGATTQSITATETGSYYCQTTASDGCIAQTPSVEVTNALTTFFRDSDGDGFGIESDFQVLCAPSNPYIAALAGDCDDSNPNINISKPELCNGIDDNCDGLIDEGFDVDNDGYRICDGDCSDNNPYIHPGAPELTNGIDDNCDGLIDTAPTSTWYIDNDGDGYGSPFYISHEPTMPSGFAANYFDCNDNESSVHPGAEEICSDNLDNNCDGLVNNCTSTCMGDLDGNGAVNVSDLLLFVGAYGTICGN